MADFDYDRAYDGGRPAVPQSRQVPPDSGDAAVPSASPVRGRWRTAAWLTLAAAVVALVAGVVAGHGFLLAAGLVLAGLSGHLFTPEFVQGRRPRPEHR